MAQVHTNKGRNAELILKRNQKLIRRYHYWSNIKRRRIDDVLQILSEEEFFISEQRIMVLLRQNQGLLDDIMKKEINKNQLNLFTDEKSD